LARRVRQDDGDVPRIAHVRPDAGRITLDGHDIKELTLDSLAGAIGAVTQETFLFHDTLR
jgi:ABC-type multidrug transport system fused ATPase/permease subunit